jgi:acylphosphatase
MKEWKAYAHIIVSGMVQGVGYRYFVYRKASEYNLKGYVKNLYNDDVEIEVEGDKGLILDFINDLKAGPRSAHVTQVKVDWEECENKFSEFQIRFA